MKRMIIYVAIILVISILFMIYIPASFADSTVDIHLYDTMYVIDLFTFIFLAIAFFGTIISIVEIIISKGKNRTALILLAIFMAVDIYYFISFSRIFT
ncbi:MAG TPA: hypothetical protein VGD17_20510, partial [Chitinophagaceae bacterium]